MLLDWGADSGKVDKFGWTPIAWAAAQEQKDITSLLLKNGACVEPEHPSHQQPLLWAVSKQNMSLVRLLLNHGADPMRLDRHGWSPLLEAVQMQDTDMLQLLISESSKVIDARQSNPYGDSALSLALELRSRKIATLLRNIVSA
ncbi:hypothetical protein N7476_004631 [Penicillium atrosanguineum]|nr:hypothetical protein N7476_004631 [Penicillium atrosanguineum]